MIEITEILPYVEYVWPFVSSSVIIAVLVQWIKKIDFDWVKPTLPVQPMLFGFVFSLIFAMILGDSMISPPGVDSPSGVVLYYTLSGAVSANVYSIVKRLFSVLKDRLPKPAK